MKKIIAILVILVAFVSTNEAFAIPQKTKQQTTKKQNVYKAKSILTIKSETKVRQKGMDFSNYLAGVQQKIKMNWLPVESDTSKRVVVNFCINQFGELRHYNLLQSSGQRNIDEAAIKAIIAGAPYEPLPIDYKGENINVKFTFEYNVVGYEYKVRQIKDRVYEVQPTRGGGAVITETIIQKSDKELLDSVKF